METQTGKESALHEPTTARGETSLFMGVTVDFLLSRLDKTNPKMLFRFLIVGLAACAAFGPGQVQGQNPRVQIPFELHDKSLKLTEWAKQPMLLNPVALSFD